MFKARFGSAERADLVRTILRSVLGREVGPQESADFLALAQAASGPHEVVRLVLAALHPIAAPRFVPPGHHYSPITPTAEVERQMDVLAARPLPESLPGIAIDRGAMVDLWRDLAALLGDVPFRAEPGHGLRYGFENGAYSWGDGSILHAMLRRFSPKRLVEIGSGWSTICSLDTIKLFRRGECAVTLIEPFPDLARSLIGPSDEAVTILDRAVQEVPFETFDALEDGDVLFIDSTHVARTGSDVCWELFEILPRLRPGVLVHIHDMFWPFEYPRSWAVDENRSWNEIYAVRALLTSNRDWRILMFNDYLAKFERPLIEATYPDFLRNPGGALWLRKTA